MPAGGVASKSNGVKHLEAEKAANEDRGGMSEIARFRQGWLSPTMISILWCLTGKVRLDGSAIAG